MTKRIIAVLMTMIMIMMMAAPAFADDSISDIKISGNKWTEGKPSMLNFGYAKVALGETLLDANSRNKCKTIKSKISANQAEGLMDDGYTIYIYAKFGARNIQYLKIKANLIITAPNGKYYRVDQDWVITDCPGTYHFSWFFDCSKAFKDIRTDNDGSLPKGTYDFTMIFNGDTFRTNSVKLT